MFTIMRNKMKYRDRNAVNFNQREFYFHQDDTIVKIKVTNMSITSELNV